MFQGKYIKVFCCISGTVPTILQENTGVLSAQLQCGNSPRARAII